MAFLMGLAATFHLLNSLRLKHGYDIKKSLDQAWKGKWLLLKPGKGYGPASFPAGGKLFFIIKHSLKDYCSWCVGLSQFHLY